MRHGTSSNRRHRSRNNNGGGGHGGNNGRRNQRTQVYDSNGPDVRIRGTAHQVAEKYLSLAKDATSMGDRMIAENYFQHAEHYIRIINELSDGQDSFKGQNNDDSVADDEGNRVNEQREQKQGQRHERKPERKQEPRSEQVKAKVKEAAEVDDLSLPASILGPDVAVKSAKVEAKQDAESVE